MLKNVMQGCLGNDDGILSVPAPAVQVRLTDREVAAHSSLLALSRARPDAQGG